MIQKVKIRDIATFVRGVSYKKDQAQKEYAEGYTAILRANNISAGSIVLDDLVFVPDSLIGEDQIVNKGDIVITMSSGSKAHVGKVALAKGSMNCAFGAFCGKLVCTGILPSYLFYLLMSKEFRNHIERQCKGTNINNIKQGYILDYEIILPTSVEQERIVSRIEELFSELDNGVETLRKTKQQLVVYRQAVLKDAFRGCEDWDKYHFSDLMSEVRNGYGLKPDDCGEYRILKISAVRPLNLDLSESRLNKTPFSVEDTIAENDILFTRYNGSREFVGVCAVVPVLPEPYAYPDKLIKCRPRLQNATHSKYLAYYMSQGDARKYLRSKVKTTSGQNGIAGGDIKKAIVYLPDLDTQARIVTEIESRLSVCDSIEKTVDIALQQAEAMRQSILKQAFEGKL